MTNIVTAVFGASKVVRTRALYQWDYGQILQFEGLDLPDAYTVHFSNQGIQGTAKTQVGNANGVTIPDEYLTTGQTVYAWVYLHAGESDGETVYSVIIPVVARPQPTEDEPTPVQQGVIDQAIAALNAGVEAAEEAAQIAIHATASTRVSSLDSTPVTAAMIEAEGIPKYVNDVSEYSDYGITETGWYIFARIAAPDGVSVTDSTTIDGAAGFVATIGAAYVDVAVWFDVAALSQRVIVNWGTLTDDILFKATDLAIRNLDYRTTFYVYDNAPYAHWEYALTSDATFVADKQYYIKSGDEYTLAEVTAGEAVPADTYYNHSKVTFSGMARNITYKCDTVIDCPQVYVLPEIEDDVHGCWYEIRLRHSGSFSSTLQVPDGVKVATEHTQAETAGLNMVDLHYSNVGGTKLWRFLNTHSTIPE